MNTKDIITLARKYVAERPENEASARLCLADAVALYDAGDWHHAYRRALTSLTYSIGIHHPDYQRAAKHLRRGRQ